MFPSGPHNTNVIDKLKDRQMDGWTEGETNDAEVILEYQSTDTKVRIH